MFFFSPAETVESLKRADERIGGEIMRALLRAADAAASFAKTSPLYKSHTFQLRASIETKAIGGFGGVLGAGGDPRALTMATAPYAGFVENGTRAHTIVPTNAKALRFVQNGAVRFARIVRHPGTKPRPFMQQARDRAEPLLEQYLSEGIERAFSA